MREEGGVGWGWRSIIRKASLLQAGPLPCSMGEAVMQPTHHPPTLYTQHTHRTPITSSTGTTTTRSSSTSPSSSSSRKAPTVQPCQCGRATASSSSSASWASR